MARIAYPTTGGGSSLGGGMSGTAGLARVKKVAHVGMTAHGLPGVHGAPLTSYHTNRHVGDTLRTQTRDPWGGKATMKSGLSHRMVVSDTHYVTAPRTAKAAEALRNRGLRKLGGRAN